MRPAVILLGTSLIFGAAAHSGKPAVSRHRSLAAQLVGTWQLVTIVDRDAAGHISSDASLGPNPIGYLMYDGSGHVATQSMKRNRTVPAAPQVLTAKTNNISFVNGYHAYFGTYTVDEGAAIVTHRVAGALSRADVGKVLNRRIHLDGDDLTIDFETLTSDGFPVTRILKWKRVG